MAARWNTYTSDVLDLIENYLLPGTRALAHETHWKPVRRVHLRTHVDRSMNLSPEGLACARRCRILNVVGGKTPHALSLRT
jgi:hypothetical protein